MCSLGDCSFSFGGKFDFFSGKFWVLFVIFLFHISIIMDLLVYICFQDVIWFLFFQILSGICLNFCKFVLPLAGSVPQREDQLHSSIFPSTAREHPVSRASPSLAPVTFCTLVLCFIVQMSLCISCEP